MSLTMGCSQDGENWDAKYIERIAKKARETAMRRALVKQKMEAENKEAPTQ